MSVVDRINKKALCTADDRQYTWKTAWTKVKIFILIIFSKIKFK